MWRTLPLRSAVRRHRALTLMAAQRDVDLCVTCYERTYRDVLAPGFFPRVVADQAFRFVRRTVIINNVADRTDAQARAGALIASRELDSVFFVEDQIARALSITGLGAAEIGRAPYFVDWGLVLVAVPGPDLVVHVDAEVSMVRPADWISPSIDLIERDPRVMAANPRWYAPTRRHDTLERETLEDSDDFALGLGFSDQLFLARRSELAAPIYRQRCVAMRRYPMIAVSPSFEARIDAWIRHHDRLRATFRGAEYQHPDQIGYGYPSRTPREKAQYAVNWALINTARRAPVKRRCWRGL
jgi:hypothetical protein